MTMYKVRNRLGRIVAEFNTFKEAFDFIKLPENKNKSFRASLRPE